MQVLRSALLTAVVALVPLAPSALQAQQARSNFELSVPNIMLGPEHVGEAPSAVQWSDDGQWIYFRWKPGGQAWHEEMGLYRVRASGGAPEKLSDEDADAASVLLARGDLSPDERSRVVSHRGDLYLIDRRSLDVRRLTDTRDSETNPVFSRDGTSIYFLRSNNLYSLSLERGELRQLTDVRSGSPEGEREPSEQRQNLIDQQLELFEHIQLKASQREESEARREAREAEELQPVYISKDERIVNLAIEPDERYAILQVMRTARDARGTMVPAWVTESGYTEPLNVRNKVGDEQSESRLALLSLEDGELSWLELWPEDAELPEGKYDSELSNVSFAGWNDAGTKGIIVASSYDNKNRWIYTIDARTGELTRVATDRDEAWIAGPCGFGCAGWMPDDESIYFASERSGYAHLYTVRADGTGLRALTEGEWEVHSVALSHDDQRFYLTTNEGSPFEFHFYHMGLDGSNRTRITSETGRHAATPSPDGQHLAVVYSYSNQPPELFITENRAGASRTQLTTSPTEEWSAFDWIDPEIVHVPAHDGVDVPARIYRPAEMGAQPNGAAVIFVHGAGYLQNVHRGWSSYYREYMFHHVLASRGYTVLDIDYRGSAGYGRDWRTAIYRHMGGMDLSDQFDGARWLVENEGIEHGRVGVYGGSYGGFITLMALFTDEEQIFGAGAALRSVTDWAHYNHGYTGRILNFPQDDDEAYRRSSPIYFAEGLQAPLLIAHGMVDTNVHFSDVARLAQRLIELGKTDWEMAVYPVEDHAFVEPSSWSDEYRRILELFERHLPAQRAQVSSDEP